MKLNTGNIYKYDWAFHFKNWVFKCIVNMHNYYNGIHIHKFSKGVKYTFYISAILSFNVTIIFIDMTHKTKKLEHNISHPSNSLLFCIYDRFHNLVHTKFPFLFNLFSTMHLKILHTMLTLLQLYFFHKCWYFPCRQTMLSKSLKITKVPIVSI